MFETALRTVIMVSKTSALLIGALVLFVFASRSKGSGDIVQSVFGAIPNPTPINPNAAEITGLNQLLSQAQSLLRNTFKAPIIPKGLGGGPCRGPNCLGIFQARGTLSSFDPFTGQRLAIGGSSKFQQITGSNFAANLQRITQGNQIRLDLTNFIKGIMQQIGILESTNNVTL